MNKGKAKRKGIQAERKKLKKEGKYATANEKRVEKYLSEYVKLIAVSHRPLC